MGFVSRSVSIMRYRVRGEIESSFWDVVDEGIRKYAFREVESSGDETGLGWTSVEDFSDHQFQGASYLIGNYVALSLRIDSVRVPSKVLEMHFKQESRKLIQDTGASRLSSGQRRDLKDRLKETLKKQAFPSIQVFDLVWDTAKTLAYFTSHSPKARERVEDLFKKSFGLSLVPLIPYLRAEEVLQHQAERAFLEKLRPSSMVP